MARGGSEFKRVCLCTRHCLAMYIHWRMQSFLKHRSLFMLLGNASTALLFAFSFLGIYNEHVGGNASLERGGSGAHRRRLCASPAITQLKGCGIAPCGRRCNDLPWAAAGGGVRHGLPRSGEGGFSRLRFMLRSGERGEALEWLSLVMTRPAA